MRLGTSVIVLPMRHPLPLAKELSTLHNLSGGRLILGVGVGWLEPEFAALGVPFNERGRRMDEGIAMMRAVWSQDPVTFEAKHIPAVVKDMTMRDRVAAYEAAGVQHVMVHPQDREVDDWDIVIEGVGRLANT